MAITRTPMVDDDGTGTTGTVINNAWKQELYNQIDAADATSGQTWIWTPFTPKWWTAGTEITALGNHALTGYYVKRGEYVTLLTLMQVGSDPLPGGAWTFGLPVPAPANYGLGSVSGLFFHSGTGLTTLLVGRSFGFGDRYDLLTTAATPPGLTAVTNAYPVALVAGCFLHLQGFYKTGAALRDDLIPRSL